MAAESAFSVSLMVKDTALEAIPEPWKRASAESQFGRKVSCGWTPRYAVDSCIHSPRTELLNCLLLIYYSYCNIPKVLLGTNIAEPDYHIS